MLHEFEHAGFGPYADAMSNFRIIVGMQALAGVPKGRLPKFADLFPRLDALWSKRTAGQKAKAQEQDGNLKFVNALLAMAGEKPLASPEQQQGEEKDEGESYYGGGRK